MGISRSNTIESSIELKYSVEHKNSIHIISIDKFFVHPFNFNCAINKDPQNKISSFYDDQLEEYENLPEENLTMDAYNITYQIETKKINSTENVQPEELEIENWKNKIKSSNKRR